jgi:hypothetical protein
VESPLIGSERHWNLRHHTGPVCSSLFVVPQEVDLTTFVGWFQGLSQVFLSARTARLLAGMDRLDKELMIGGKFQMEVAPGPSEMRSARWAKVVGS